MDYQPAQVSDIVFEWNYHQVTANDMAHDMVARLGALPHSFWCELRVGQTYLVEGTSRHQEVWKVERVLPSGKMIDVSTPDGKVRRLHESRYRCSCRFTALDAHMQSMLGVRHEDIVYWAHQRGLDVPTAVRRQYPWIFVTIPERFGKRCDVKPGQRRQNCDHYYNSAEYRLYETLNPFRREPATVESLEEAIEVQHNRIEQHSLQSVLSGRPETANDAARILTDAEHNIDFLRWVQTQIAPGGPLA